jgi:hypothetical protein
MCEGDEVCGGGITDGIIGALDPRAGKINVPKPVASVVMPNEDEFVLVVNFHKFAVERDSIIGITEGANGE